MIRMSNWSIVWLGLSVLLVACSPRTRRRRPRTTPTPRLPTNRSATTVHSAW